MIHSPPPPPAQPLARTPASARTGTRTVSTDAALLKGNVPSPADWKDAWAIFSETMSLRQEARLHDKKHSASGETLINGRRKHHRMQLVMAEVIRVNIRRVFSEATHISLALDEAQYLKVVRFRADVPSQQMGLCKFRWSARGFRVQCIRWTGYVGLLQEACSGF